MIEPVAYDAFVSFLEGFSERGLRLWPRFSLRVGEERWTPEWEGVPFEEAGLCRGTMWCAYAGGMPLAIMEASPGRGVGVDLLCPLGPEADRLLAESMMSLPMRSVTSGVCDAAMDGRYVFDPKAESVDACVALSSDQRGVGVSMRSVLRKWMGADVVLTRGRLALRWFVVGPLQSGYCTFVEEAPSQEDARSLAENMERMYAVEFRVVREREALEDFL